MWCDIQRFTTWQTKQYYLENVSQLFLTVFVDWWNSASLRWSFRSQIISLTWCQSASLAVRCSSRFFCLVHHLLLQLFAVHAPVRDRAFTCISKTKSVPEPRQWLPSHSHACFQCLAAWGACRSQTSCIYFFGFVPCAVRFIQILWIF